MTREGNVAKGSAAREKRVPLEGAWRDIVERLFQMGWSDGLPVIPPVEEAVQEMVEHVGRCPRLSPAGLMGGRGHRRVS